MSNTVAFPVPAPDPVSQPSLVQGLPSGGVAPQAKASIQPAPDLRLVIEEDPVSGSYIYKTLDRRTGEVVQQLPREEVLRLKDASVYAPGTMVDSTT
jgi:flagellar protein FlaG